MDISPKVHTIQSWNLNSTLYICLMLGCIRLASSGTTFQLAYEEFGGEIVIFPRYAVRI